MITGASRGIGAATATAFAAAGAKVALASRDREALDRVAGGLRSAFVVEADLSRVEDATRMVRHTAEHFGRLDVLINNAAKIQALYSDRLGAADVRAAMDTNLIGPMAATREALKVMRRQGRGHVINIGMPGYLLGVPLLAPYAASKAALSSWTRALQAELEETEILVSEYFPGHVDTGSQPESELGEFAAVPDDDPNQSPLTRWLASVQSPEEVADHLVDCVRRPRKTVYSSPAVRFGTALGLFTRLRIHVASRAARAQRARVGAAVFSPDDARRAPTAAATSSPPQPFSAGVAAPPRETEPPQQSDERQTAAAAVKTKARKSAAAKTKKTAGKKRATKKKPAAKKAVALTPEATARVRAAAERAAASARGGSPIAPTKSPVRSGTDDGET